MLTINNTCDSEVSRPHRRKKIKLMKPLKIRVLLSLFSLLYGLFTEILSLNYLPMSGAQALVLRPYMGPAAHRQSEPLNLTPSLSPTQVLVIAVLPKERQKSSRIF